MTTITRRRTDGIDFRLLATDEEGMPVRFDAGPIPGVAGSRTPARPGHAWKAVLQELIACRQLLDTVLKG